MKKTDKYECVFLKRGTDSQYVREVQEIEDGEYEVTGWTDKPDKALRDSRFFADQISSHDVYPVNIKNAVL